MVGRCLGIDFGERRIGLAISDERGRVAVPLAVLERRDDATAVREIGELAERERVARIVVGDPIRVDGSTGEAALRARSFGGKLAQATGLPVEMIPETLTSVEAEHRLPGMRRSARRGVVDALAAQILLQEALDRRDDMAAGSQQARPHSGGQG
ncbi:MAG: Holliday junction resolvase RuvX [Thermoanaerobaculia bacterium]